MVERRRHGFAEFTLHDRIISHVPHVHIEASHPRSGENGNAIREIPARALRSGEFCGGLKFRFRGLDQDAPLSMSLSFMRMTPKFYKHSPGSRERGYRASIALAV